MGRAPFAPCVDGFAFVNDWKFDDVEKQTLHDVLTAALPAVKAITWPVIGPIVEPAIALQLPFAGPFLPIVLYYEVKAINDAVVNAIAGAVEAKDYGLCGGMAFASLDYWLQGWVVPRGISGGDQPSRDTPEGTVLRDYLWARLLDSVLANGVTILSWMAILHIPFLGGAQWAARPVQGAVPGCEGTDRRAATTRPPRPDRHDPQPLRQPPGALLRLRRPR